MKIRTPPIPPVTITGSGPGEYFSRKKNARGIKRDPAPRKLFGDPRHFDRLVRLSPAAHPHLHCVLNYKGEPLPPSRKTKDQILKMHLHLLRGGLAADKVYVLGVDHGDHDHVAMFRHLVARDWPRFQPYFHDNDWLLVSDFQWLVNRRYNFNAPENPKNTQLVSLAGRKFGDEEIAFLAELRAEIVAQEASGLFCSHDAFVDHLTHKMECKTELVIVTDAEDPTDDEVNKSGEVVRVWMKVTTLEGLVVPIKGPICHPDYSLGKYGKAQEEKAKLYRNFLRDPSMVWNRFRDGYRKRCEYNLKRHPAHREPKGADLFLGFDELEPSRHIIIPPPASFDIS